MKIISGGQTGVDRGALDAAIALGLDHGGWCPLGRLAEDGQHGLEVLDEGTPDVIITDINMPRLDGFGFIDAVRARDESRLTPILVLTTESSPELKARARDAGATGWIVKPFAQDKLIAALRKVAG